MVGPRFQIDELLKYDKTLLQFNIFTWRTDTNSVSVANSCTKVSSWTFQYVYENLQSFCNLVFHLSLSLQMYFSQNPHCSNVAQFRATKQLWLYSTVSRVSVNFWTDKYPCLIFTHAKCESLSSHGWRDKDHGGTSDVRTNRALYLGGVVGLMVVCDEFRTGAWKPEGFAERQG